MGPSKRATTALRAVALASLALCCGVACSRAVETRSDIKGASLVALTKLPHSPESGALDEYCEGYRAKKLTSTGLQVANLGWIVTSEQSLGRYRAVTFASGFDPGTSAMCSARNANIGIFDGPKLIALAYTSRPADLILGVAEPMENGGLLIWSGGWVGPPVGELHTEHDSLRLTSIAPERTFCHQSVVVPKVYGEPIDAARKVFISHGWRPLLPTESPGEGDFGAKELAQRGVVEAQSCSGTGTGYCSFKYSGPGGQLDVTTIGGPDTVDNSVIDYSVTCRAG